MKLQVFLLVVSLSGCFCANLVANLQGRDLVGFIRDVSGEGAQKPTWSCWRVGWSVGWAGCYCGSLVGFYQLFKGPKALYIVITKFVGYDQIDHCPKFQGSLLFFVGQFFVARSVPKVQQNEVWKKQQSSQILEFSGDRAISGDQKLIETWLGSHQGSWTLIRRLKNPPEV